ncbi:MAG TPA: FGGY family carbohydrate kinase [Candidatus Limnocylindria bacterium]|jgi:sugar (pentulose or hexulose) kinase
MPGAGEETLVAIDVGTSGARATAFDLAGERLLEVRRSYPTTSPVPGWAEQDPRDWRRAALAALAGLVGQLGPRPRVAAIGLTGQCPSVCLVDANGGPVSAGLIYRDNRATAEAAVIRQRFGDAAIHARTGHLPAAFHIAPKLLWLQAHEPAAFRRASRALQPRDLVGHALTGEMATDGTHAAATLVFDLRRREWAHDLQDALGLSPELFPPLRPSWEPLGGLAESVAQRVGLPPGVPVILGGADSQACALGAAVVAAGPVSEMAGSSTCLNAAVAKPLTVLEVTHYPHVVPGPFTTETGINTTGAAIAWVADLLFARRGRRAAEPDYARLNDEAADVPAGSDGVLALPTLADGERTDPDLRAAFSGLSLRHGRGVLARAMLEGVAFAIRDQLALLTAGGARVTELRVSGGDTRLATWNRIKADVIGVPVVTVPGDAAVTGVAMLAGLGAGIYRGFDDAIGRCVRLASPIEPDPAAHAHYDERFAAWRELAAADVARRAG